MAIERRKSQMVLITDVQSGETIFDQVDFSPRKRKGRRIHTFQEQTSSLEDWWVTNEMTSRIYEEANTWVQRKSAQILEFSHQDSSYSSHVASSDDAIGKLSEAFHAANFKPIVLLGIARKLGSERRVMRIQLQGMGHWVDEYFDHVIDILTDEDNGAKPNVTPELKQTLKGIVKGSKARFLLVQRVLFPQKHQ